MRGSMINHAHRGGTLRLAFLSAVVSLVVSFAAAAAPIPLYNIYRAEDGFTNAGISMAVVAYAVGTIAALLVLGRMSKSSGPPAHCDRQPRPAPAGLSAVAECARHRHPAGRSADRESRQLHP